jgi:hypothetical protein
MSYARVTIPKPTPHTAIVLRIVFCACPPGLCIKAHHTPHTHTHTHTHTRTHAHTDKHNARTHTYTTVTNGWTSIGLAGRTDGGGFAAKTDLAEATPMPTASTIGTVTVPRKHRAVRRDPSLGSGGSSGGGAAHLVRW